MVLSGSALWDAWSRDGQFQYDAPNSPALELSLALTIGYFAADTAAMWLRYFTVPGETEVPFVFTVRALSRRGLGATLSSGAGPQLHHLACMGYAGACRHFGLGALTAAVATLVGEVTNPMQNVWLMSKATGNTALHNTLSPIFTYFFVATRCMVTPLWSGHIVAFCLRQPNAFGTTMGQAFALICVLVNLGGLMWARDLWRGHCKHQTKLAEAKKSS